MVREGSGPLMFIVMDDRRAFLVRLATGMVAVGAYLSPGPGTLFASGARGCAGTNAMGRSRVGVGIQLYTLREAMARDPERTLERLARMGYDEVEFAGYFGWSPREVRAVLAGVGLDSPSAHVGLDALRDDLEATMATAAAIGHRWVVCPWVPVEERTPDGYRRLAALLNRAGDSARAAGLRVAYHNHEFEFDPLPGDDLLPLELLLKRTDPALVDFELDLYWAVRAGHDPIAWFRRHPGRFPLVHVKDMDGTAARGMVDPGQGVIDFAAIIAARDQGGVRHWFVEHDDPADPFATARTGLEYLRGLTRS
jgi:sugar phosphate isomerase/epimerase